MKDRALLLLLTFALAASPAAAAEITGFLSGAGPGELWKTGAGGTLTTTWFQVINLEAEVARQPGEALDSSQLSFTGSALLAPPIGKLVPYAGFGIGVFRQKDGSDSDTGTLKVFVLGAKLRFTPLFLLRADYRETSLSGDPLFPFDRRFYAGAGISF